MRPLLKQLESLGKSAVPFTTNFSGLFESLRNTGGLERIMDFVFLGTGSANGYDALGHFLRAEGVGNACLELRGHAVAPRAAGASCSATPAPRRVPATPERFGGERQQRRAC